MGHLLLMATGAVQLLLVLYYVFALPRGWNPTRAVLDLVLGAGAAFVVLVLVVLWPMARAWKLR